MTRSAVVQFEWAGDERTFCLKLKQLDLLQERCGERGPKRILSDLLTGDWKHRDVVETIRLGLIGGGMPAPEADKLIRKEMDGEPIEPHLWAAVPILQAVLVGAPKIEDETEEGDDDAGKTEATKTGSTSPPSTEPAAQSDGPRSRSVN